jgi:hypothetical protein
VSVVQNILNKFTTDIQNITSELDTFLKIVRETRDLNLDVITKLWIEHNRLDTKCFNIIFEFKKINGIAATSIPSLHLPECIQLLQQSFAPLSLDYSVKSIDSIVEDVINLSKCDKLEDADKESIKQMIYSRHVSTISKNIDTFIAMLSTVSEIVRVHQRGITEFIHSHAHNNHKTTLYN